MNDAATLLEEAAAWHKMADAMRTQKRYLYAQRREQVMYYFLLLWAECEWRPEDDGTLPYGFACHGVTDGGCAY